MPVENTGVRELESKLVAEGIGVPTESGILDGWQE